MMNYDNPLIFLVNDNPTYNRLLEKFIQMNGFSRIMIFREGEDCLKQLSLKPDIVVLDYSLPGKNGLDILHEIKKTNTACHVIFLSGQPNIEIALTAVKQGAADYIVKDKRAFDRLIRKIDNLCFIAKKLQKNHKVRRNLYIFLAIYLIGFIFLIVMYYARG